MSVAGGVVCPRASLPAGRSRPPRFDPVGPQSWSESKKVADLWASKKPGGRVFVLPKGSRGLRVLDYTTSAFDAEKEWVVWL